MRPLPADVDVFSVVLNDNVTPDQARDIQFIVGTASQSKAWGGPTSYMWPTNCSTATILLVQRPGEEGATLAFSIVYTPESDVESILQQASNPSHLAYYQKLGLAAEQIQMHTFQFTKDRKWEPVVGVPKGVSRSEQPQSRAARRSRDGRRPPRRRS